MVTYSQMVENEISNGESFINNMDSHLEKFAKHDYSSILEVLGEAFKPIKVSTTLSDFLVSEIMIEFKDKWEREITDTFNEFAIPIEINKPISFNETTMYIVGTLKIDGELITDRDSTKFGLMTLELKCKLYDSFGDNEIFQKLNWAQIEEEVNKQIKLIL
jgi:hypothetical protein